MNKTKISWTERTWNPVTGCTKYSAGCAHCYAEVMSRRLCAMGNSKYANGFKSTMHINALTEPLKWRKPSTIFVCSMSDLFHKDVPFEFIDKVFKVIEETPHHNYQILTKRAERMAEYFAIRNIPRNVWVGVTVENENTKQRIGYIRNLKAVVKFLSCEPLIGDLGELDLHGINWIIVGGESGNQARPMKKEWVLNIKRQCEEQGVPFFFKQWGTYGEDGVKRNKEANGHTIDGQVFQAWPKVAQSATNPDTNHTHSHQSKKKV